MLNLKNDLRDFSYYCSILILLMELVIVFICIFAVTGLILFLPIKGARAFKHQPPTQRFHEADAVLSRRLLNPGTESYKSYYDHHPESREWDDRSRSAPGLLSADSRYFHPGTFAASKANFEIIDFLGSKTHGTPGAMPLEPTAVKKIKVNLLKVTRFITRWLKQTGAHSVGVTPLKDYHLYSHKGRGSRSGDRIEQTHRNAIAIIVEMDHRMMQSAPAGTTVMESSEQYLRSGVLALKVASYIRELGYEATAHIDGNYEVICPLVAVDAGLGVIGRMGLLMTPDLGPRVRISVVTTNMPLAYSKSNPDRTTLHFCHNCKKCAHVCPAAAISEGPRKQVDGVERWQINSEKCYHYWTLSGTDCGMCITACPYSHPNDWFHRFIRRGIKNNLVFRTLAIKLDNLFYGRKPPMRPLPDWTDIMDEL
ncbi:MAG: 4Fe-4S dicluster domain-containing protein [Bacteroidales bacterium]|nr:4Fe-4S dicluster domain-containing protein [Bacteroidales bacterium]